jgi:hypothetical protein
MYRKGRNVLHCEMHCPDGNSFPDYYCSFIVVSKMVLEKFKSELEGYETSGTTIHFSAEKPLPAALVKKIVKARIEENELRVT